MGERLEPILAAELAHSAQGDSDAAHAIVRDHFVQRAQRLLRLGRARLAMTALRSALPGLPAAERTLIAASTDSDPPTLPPVVLEPGAFLVSQEHAVRVAATALWSLGQAPAAVALLEAQTRRGDARGLLQLCTLQAFSDDHAGATQCLQQLEALDSSVASEAAPLIGMLHSMQEPAP
jgi:hypothetical protein